MIKKISGQKNIENYIQGIRDKRIRLYEKRMRLFNKPNSLKKEPLIQ